ncbi:MAG: TolC family protein [Deltaproteobacteria bacterium]
MRFFLIVLLLTIITYHAEAADAPLSLSLKEAIRMGVEKNLEVRAELYNPAQFEADINRGQAIYDPTLAIQTSYTDSKSPVTTTGGGTNNSQSFLLNSSLNRLFWTGGTAAITFNNSHIGISAPPPSSLGNYWQSDLAASFTQPLLKNAGREATEIVIGVARLSKFASIEKFRTRLLNTVAGVKAEYLKLYSLREQLNVRKISLDLSNKILLETKARVKAGVLPAMEILNAEFGSSSREKDLIDAEKAVRDQEDVLRLMLQLGNSGEILITDVPDRLPIDISEDESRKRAFSRPDITEQKRNLEMEELKTRVFSNKTSPDLSLTGKVGLTGLDRTFDKAASFDNPYWSLGLNFSYPLGNGASDNDYRKSRLKVEQIALQIRSLEEGAANEVKAAIRGVTTSFKQMDVADRGKSFAEERLRAFTKKNEVGLATTKDVLDVENDLALARNNQIAAVVNYNNAIISLWKATGELLEREGIHVVENDADKLYKNIR